MILLAALALAQAPPPPPPGFILDPYDAISDPAPERLGPGPHTLVISSRSGIARMDYRTGPQCQRARDAALRQLRPAPRPGVIYGPPSTHVFCVPR